MLMKNITSRVNFNLFLSCLFFLCCVQLSSAQCPTITQPTQSFCDLEAPTIADLVATDNGGGVVCMRLQHRQRRLDLVLVL